MKTATIPSSDWEKLSTLANDLTQINLSPGNITAEEFLKVETTLETLYNHQDWEGILQLEGLFHEVLTRETLNVQQVFRQLMQYSIQAAESLNDISRLAALYKAEGHNLHQLGYHQKAITVFTRAAQLHQELGDAKSAFDSTFMTSLCYRALGNYEEAWKVVNWALENTLPDEPQRSHPLRIKAWLERDEKHFDVAEALLREALSLQPEGEKNIYTADTLADLGELVGLRGDKTSARKILFESLEIIRSYKGQYARQEARTLTKLAELSVSEGNYGDALNLLQQADDNIRAYGPYLDLLWKIEVVRAMIYFQTGKIGDGFRKLRLALQLHGGLGLSFGDFFKKIYARLNIGTGAPRKK